MNADDFAQLTKKAIGETAREILWRVDLRQPLLGEDAEFISLLLDWHPCADLKRGAGVAFFYVDVTPRFASRGFYICRTDMSSVDFSYKVCLTPSVETRVKKVMRLEVLAQIENLRLQLGATADDDLHHADPTFDELARTWLTLRGGARESLLDHGPGISRLIPEMSQDWRAFHLEHARLIVIPRVGHRALAHRE